MTTDNSNSMPKKNPAIKNTFLFHPTGCNTCTPDWEKIHPLSDTPNIFEHNGQPNEGPNWTPQYDSAVIVPGVSEHAWK